MQLRIGETLKLVGNAPALGAWCHHDAPSFTWSPDDIWQISVTLPLDELTEFKIVAAAEAHGDTSWCNWQEGENTILDPAQLGLQSGAQLEVGCDWQGESRAQVMAGAAAASAAAQLPLLEALQAAGWSADPTAAASGEAQQESGATSSQANAATEKLAEAAPAADASAPVQHEPATDAATQPVVGVETEHVQENAQASAAQSTSVHPDTAALPNATKSHSDEVAEGSERAGQGADAAEENVRVARAEAAPFTTVSTAVSTSDVDTDDGKYAQKNADESAPQPAADAAPTPESFAALQPTPDPEAAKPWVVAGSERAQRAGAHANVIYDPASETWTFAVVSSSSDSDDSQEPPSRPEVTFLSRPSGGGSRGPAPSAATPAAPPIDAGALVTPAPSIDASIAAMVEQAQSGGAGTLHRCLHCAKLGNRAGFGLPVYLRFAC